MKTIVLDDDPTGTQSAHGVEVLLDWDVDVIADALRHADSSYILTNTRAMTEDAAVALLTGIREQCVAACARLGEQVTFVLRGDSTLRGHVFPESEVFASPASLLAFVPAYPAGGRITRDGVHLVRLHDELVPAHATEYADDPVFPFDTAVLRDYVAQRSSRPVTTVQLATVRGGGDHLASAVLAAADGSVLLFDVETDEDITQVAVALRAARAAGRDVVIRSAATLAAELAGVRSRGLLDVPLQREPGRTLLVCGSHTEGAARQLEAVIVRFGPPIEIDTEAALADSERTGRAAGMQAFAQLAAGRLGFLATERVRSAAHNTLEHGERVMRALTAAVSVAAPHVSAVVSKGGITSAEVARVGIGASRATVRGQVLAGVSVWDLRGHDGHPITYVVVPGNVGDGETLTAALTALGTDQPQDAQAF